MATHAAPIQRERREGPVVAGELQAAAPVTEHQAKQQALQQALDQSPRVAQLRGLQQMLAQAPNVARQNRLAATLAPRGDARSGVLQAKGNGQTVAGRLPLRATLLGSTSLTPVQRVPWWLPGIKTLVGAAGSAYVGAKTGALAGSLIGPWGTTIGGAVGGVAGLVGGLLGGVTGGGAVAGVGGGAYAGATLGGKIGGVPGAIVGGLGGALLGGATGLVSGAALQDAIPARPPVRLANEKVPSLGTVTFRRAVEKATAKGHKGNAIFEQGVKLLDDPELRAYMESEEAETWISQQPKEVQNEPSLIGTRLIDRYYEKVNAKANFGAAQDDAKFADIISKILENDPFIKNVFEGKLAEQPEAVEGGALKVPKDAPSEVQTATGMFNRLVGRKVTDLPAAKRVRSPGSGIMRETGMQLGWASPAGAALHELGHHLEYGLEPSEFASLHNFMRARSKSERRRYVGYQGLAGGLQTETGYDMAYPDLGITPSPPLTNMIGSSLKYPFSQNAEHDKAGSDIDRFIVGQGNKPETSYASQVYETSYDTEFLSTTIHFFADPELALKLVRNDPLRACLFLSLANPKVYERVRKHLAIDAPQAPDLNKLIHKVTPDNAGKGLGQHGDLKVNQ